MRHGIAYEPSREVVMAGLVPAIHALLCGTKNVDARDKPGHDAVKASKSQAPTFAAIALAKRQPDSLSEMRP